MSSTGSSKSTDQREHPRARPQPTHFPAVLKQERLARHLKQEVLAAQLHISERTLVSWETGARLPPVGMVLYLSRRLLGSEHLDNRLMRAYLLDDLAWQLSLRQDETILGDLQAAFVELEQGNEAEIEQQEAQAERPLVLFEQSALAPSRDGASGKEQRGRQVEAPPGVVGKSGGDEAVQGLLAVLDTLRREPSLVSVVLDFLREMGYGGSAGGGC